MKPLILALIVLSLTACEHENVFEDDMKRQEEALLVTSYSNSYAPLNKVKPAPMIEGKCLARADKEIATIKLNKNNKTPSQLKATIAWAENNRIKCTMSNEDWIARRTLIAQKKRNPTLGMSCDEQANYYINRAQKNYNDAMEGIHKMDKGNLGMHVAMGKQGYENFVDYQERSAKLALDTRVERARNICK